MADQPTQEKVVIPLQIGRFKDNQGRFLQDRFESWCREAADALMTVDPISGEPVFAAGDAKADLTVKITLTRLADDAATFAADASVKTSLPDVGFKGRTTVLTSDDGLIEKATPDELSLFNPAHGQPEIGTAPESAALI